MTTGLKCNAASAHCSFKVMIEAKNTFHTQRCVGISVILTFACRNSTHSKWMLVVFSHCCLVFGELLVCGILGLHVRLTGEIANWTCVASSHYSLWEKQKLNMCTRDLETQKKSIPIVKTPTFAPPWKTSEQRNCLCCTHTALCVSRLTSLLYS